MKIEQIYTGCLSQGAYYIEIQGEIAIIDPLREIGPYLMRAEKDKAKIKYIFETHFHADFVSGHLTLSKQTGASIVFGPTANPNFDAIIAKDGQIFPLGKITLTALHTPGHTMESTTYLLKDENGKDYAIFSGDTLFLGDVGRPDLAQKAINMTKEQLAGLLYESLQTKIIPLHDEVIVYPAHGAGSACGKNMMKETFDTLGNQKKVNYALRKGIKKEDFIREVTDGLLPPPAYFPFNVKMNKEGYEDIDTVIKRGATPLNPDEFVAIANQTDALILDVRSEQEFAQSHIPRSIFIGIDGGFAPWVGALIKDVNQAILLVAPSGREEETITRLSRVGFDNTIGFLKGGMNAWRKAAKETDAIQSITVDVFEKIYFSEQPAVFDVRKENEYVASHLKNAENRPLDNLNDFLKQFPSDENFYIHCAGGYRSIIAASILKSRGIHNLIDIAGGFGAMKDTRLEFELQK